MDMIYATLYYLRRGVSKAYLAARLGVSEMHVTRVIRTWLIVFRNRLRTLDLVLSQEEYDLITPESFKQLWGRDYNILVDSTNGNIAKPSSKEEQRNTFDSY